MVVVALNRRIFVSLDRHIEVLHEVATSVDPPSALNREATKYSPHAPSNLGAWLLACQDAAI